MGAHTEAEAQKSGATAPDSVNGVGGLLKVVFGAMTLGKQGTSKHGARSAVMKANGYSGAEGARIHDLKDCAAVLDTLQKHGHEEIDTARVYGASEELLGELHWQERGLVLATKLNPRRFGPNSYSHSPNDLRRGLADSLTALQASAVDLFYLHTPDHNIPYAETLATVNELYEAGLFRRFGISNYTAWEVAQICELCERNGWKKPDVYQGCYHALQRSVEPELFPCLRHYNIAFYAFSPLAGGMLTDKYHRDTTDHEQGSRFDPSRFQGKSFRNRYWNEAFFAALDVIRGVANSFGITTAEAAMRWECHHSKMQKHYGDAVVTGASSATQLEENLTYLSGDPLPDPLVKAFDEAWALVKGTCGPYFV